MYAMNGCTHLLNCRKGCTTSTQVTHDNCSILCVYTEFRKIINIHHDHIWPKWNGLLGTVTREQEGTGWKLKIIKTF